MSPTNTLYSMTGTIGLANPISEEALLSCILNNPDAIIAAQASRIQVVDFGYEKHQLIYDASLTLYEKGVRPDPALVISELNKNGKLDLVGDGVVTAIAESPHDHLLATEYARTIKECAIRRRVNDECRTIIEEVYSEPDVQKLVANSEDRIFSIGESINSLDHGYTIKELLDRRSSRDIDDEFFPFTFASLNDVNRGRKRGSLTIIGGYSSEGKSSVSISETINSCSNGRDVALFSLEMTEDQVINRMISKMSKVPCKHIDEDTLTSIERRLVDSSIETMKGWKLRVYADPSVTPDDIRALQMRHRHDHIIIDYLQRFDYTDYSEITRIAKKFKNLALQTKCAVDLLSQITPAAVYPGKNTYPKPTKQNLYGSKATAHEADIILFVWAHREKNGGDEGWNKTGFGQLIVDKYRDGVADWSFDIRFNDSTVCWEES